MNKIKKIGLAIVYDYPDYGSMLQALATQITLSKMGYDSEAINTDALKNSIKRRKYKYFTENIFDITIINEKSKIISKKLKQKLNKNFAQKQAFRNAAFKKFKEEKFIESIPYKSWEQLTKACNDYIAVLVGSDQLWLPSNVAADYYTLSFVPSTIKKISYATSFGIGSIPEKYKKTYKKYLSRFEYLSAREISGQTIINKMTSRNVPLVCDPTLLLDEKQWNVVATSRRLIEEKYVFCYFMGDNPEQRDWARKLADKHNCKIVALLHLDQFIASDENYVDYAPYNISPADFISLVKNAEYVCTDSFHGTVFSIIYSKDFFTFKRFNKKASLSTNTRIFSLLDRLKLSERLFTAKENIDTDLTIKNYQEIQKGVSEFREKSIEYLKMAIDGQNVV